MAASARQRCGQLKVTSVLRRLVQLPAIYRLSVTALLPALSYRTQSWSISMPFAGLYW